MSGHCSHTLQRGGGWGGEKGEESRGEVEGKEERNVNEEEERGGGEKREVGGGGCKHTTHSGMI